MDTTSISSKADYLEKCQKFAEQHFKQNGMFVVYLRSRQPKFACEVTPDERKEITHLLELIPGLNERNYERFVAETNKGGAKAPSLAAFRTVRSIVRANCSPLRGVIVGFKQGKDIKIGWSMCNKKDRFNQFDGIRRAIERAEPIPLVHQKCTLTETSKSAGEYTGPENGMVPHTCVPHLRRAIERAVAIERAAVTHFSDKEKKA